MKTITNLQLIGAAIIVMSLLVFLIQSPEMTPLHRVFFYLLLLGFGGLVWFALDRLQMILNEKSMWRNQVTGRVGARLVNGVVFIWLCVVGLLFYILLGEQEPINAATFGGTFVFLGIVIGRYLQRRSPNYFLLPYGLSFSAMLMLITLVIIAI